MQLTPRADKIIRILLRFSPDSPVTIGIISEELGVSDRSVQRELPTVEKWMKHNGFCFVRKRSVGLLIDETPERLEELAALLDEKDTNSSAPADNRPERLTLLCHDLLLAEEPIKSYYFTEKFEISEGTLTADLNQLETWFTKYQLKLVRRPGLGVFIEGTEIARRQALTSFICKQVNEHHSIGNLQDRNSLVCSFLTMDIYTCLYTLPSVYRECKKDGLSKNSNSLMQKYLSSRSMPFPNIL